MVNCSGERRNANLNDGEGGIDSLFFVQKDMHRPSLRLLKVIRFLYHSRFTFFHL